MKKLILLLAAILVGISAAFAQVYQVKVNWDDENCACEGTVSGSYFKAQISIYDDANTQWVVQNQQATTSDARPTYVILDVPSVETYCKESHLNTPSFTVTATAWLMCDETNPPTAVCTDSDDYSPYDCHDFYDAVVNLTPALVLY